MAVQQAIRHPTHLTRELSGTDSISLLRELNVSRHQPAPGTT